MKKTLFIALIGSMILTQACQSNVNASDKKTSKVEEVSNGDEEFVITLTKEEFKLKVMDYEKNKEWKFEGNLPCIVDFYADWCRPCKMAAPILEEIAKEYKGKIKVYKVNTQKDPEIPGVFGVKGIPAFLYCPMKGKPQMTSGIGSSNEETKEMFRNAIEQILIGE